MKTVNAVKPINHRKMNCSSKFHNQVGMNMAFGLIVKNYNFSVQLHNTNLGVGEGGSACCTEKLHALARWSKCIKTK